MHNVNNQVILRTIANWSFVRIFQNVSIIGILAYSGVLVLYSNVGVLACYYHLVQLISVSDNYSLSGEHPQIQRAIGIFIIITLGSRRAGLIERDPRVQIHRGEFAQGSNCD